MRASSDDLRTLEQTRQTGGPERSGTQTAGRSDRTRARGANTVTDCRHRPDTGTNTDNNNDNDNGNDNNDNDYNYKSLI